MIKILSSLLSLLDRLWAAWTEHKLRQQGWQEAEKEAADEIQRQIDLAQHVAVTPDADRDRRLRSRFDDAAD